MRQGRSGHGGESRHLFTPATRYRHTVWASRSKKAYCNLNGLQGLIEIVRDEADERVPASAWICLKLLADQLELVNRPALETDRLILASARATEVGRRLMAVPGVGPVRASAIVASLPDPNAFKSGRNLAAWIGLVPKQNSSGGKARLGGITKAGQPLPAPTAGRRRTGRHPLRRATRDQAAVARAADSPTNDEDRGRGVGQQDRPDDLGDHDQR